MLLKCWAFKKKKKKALYQNESKFISVKVEQLQQKYNFPCSLAQAKMLQEEVCK